MMAADILTEITLIRDRQREAASHLAVLAAIHADNVVAALQSMGMAASAAYFQVAVEGYKAADKAFMDALLTEVR